MSCQILHGDCRHILPTIGDATIDAIITDPPYELSNDGKASAARVALEIMFPKNAKVISSTADEDCLGFLLADIALLCRGGVVPTESATVPEGAVAFDDKPPVWDHDVAHRDVAPVRTSDGDGRVDVETQGAHYLGCFAFKLADVEAGVDALNRSGAGFVSGGVGIGFAVSTASLPGFLRSGAAIPDGDDFVGTLNDALAALVRAGSGAEDLSVPSVFNVRPGTHERCSAGSALTLLALAKACGAQLVRARSGAGGLPAMLKATRVSVVDPLADRALSFDLLLHDVNLSGVGFMGKGWDGSKIAYNVEVWRECLRVLKPGGHLLAFGGTRTYHRMACAIEDAGFEIRDSIHWLYGSGFPKSLDVSKAIDKANGRKFEDRYPLAEHIRAKRKAAGLTCADVNAWFGYSTACQHWESQHPGGARVPNIRDWQLLKGRLGLSSDWDELVARIEAEREVVGTSTSTTLEVAPGEGRERPQVIVDITAPATDAARQWEGWGTALKPAHEPIIVARKPLDGTVAANVLAHGTGALNIDGCRIDEARWPANVVIDPHIAEQHPEWANYYYCPKASTAERNTGLDGLPEGQPINGADKWTEQDRRRGEGVTRKPSANTHPTVKPLALMRWLCRLVTPPGGLILDPFAGSGTTLTAAILEHFNTIGIELTDEYHPIIQARTSWAQTHIDSQLPL